MDCKVIYVFHLSLCKAWHCLLFLLSKSTYKFEQRLASFWSFSERGSGKADLPGGAELEIVFMVKKPVLVDNVIYFSGWIMSPISVRV